MNYNDTTNGKNYIRINNAARVESISVSLVTMPNAFKAKVEELEEECGYTHDEAVKIAKDITCEIELYYHKGQGLFGVEAEAVENLPNGGIVSPYDGETELVEEEYFEETKQKKD